MRKSYHPKNSGDYNDNNVTLNNFTDNHYNRPGLPALSYRLNTHGSMLHRLLSDLPAKVLALGEFEGTQPLSKISTQDTEDITIALLDAWSVVGDVLSFYQERIVNEGYINTATERRSILEIARSIGYELNPGVAASVFLAFTVEDAPGAPSAATVPKGIRIMSIPAQNEKPQFFETSDKINTLSTWNVIKPMFVATMMELKEELVADSTSLYLKGVNTGLQPGDGIMIVGSRRIFRILQSVTQNPEEGFTLVKWKERLGEEINDNPKSEIFSFSLRASLFGQNASEWDDLSREAQLEYNPQIGGVYKSTDQGNSWIQVNEGLPTEDIRCITFDAENNIYAGTENGAFRLDVDKDNWTPINDGLMNRFVRCFATDEYNRIFAGTNDGVFLTKDKGGVWIKIVAWIIEKAVLPAPDLKYIDTNVVNGTISSLVIKNDGGLLVGTYNGIYSLDYNEGEWVTKNSALLDRTIYTIAINSENVIFAGTDDGVHRSEDGGAIWKKINVGLTNKEIRSIGIIEDEPESVKINRVLEFFNKATIPDQIVERIKDDPDFGKKTRGAYGIRPSLARKILRERDSLPQKKFRSLSQIDRIKGIGPDTLHDILNSFENLSGIFVGTPAGIFRSFDNGDKWSKINSGLTNLDVRTLIIDSNGYIFVGTADGIFRSINFGNTWRLIVGGLQSDDILCLSITHGGSIYAGTAFEVPKVNDWPGFDVERERIDLNADYPGIVVDSWVVLMDQSESIPLIGCYKCEDVISVVRNNFALSEKITRILPDMEVDHADFSRRETVCFAQSKRLQLFEIEVENLAIVKGNNIDLDRLITGIENGKPLAVSGKRIRAILNLKNNEDNLQLVAPDEIKSEILKDGDIFEVLSLPTDEINGDRFWHLKDRFGFSGVLKEMGKDLITLMKSSEEDKIVSEIAFVDMLVHNEHTSITLRYPLSNVYDAATVMINANVVGATHGETVEEVIGTGDATVANQSFKLRKKPLTFTSAPTATGGKSTLQIRVNDILWEEVTSLNELDGISRNYVVHADNELNETIIFGDGKRGARLPSAVENVKAIYRSGIGPEGEVSADSLSLLQSRPLGIRSVTNPLKASGAAEQESLENARINAPRTVLTMNRIVSLQDFEDFVQTFAGIGKGQVVALWRGERKIVHITIAAESGDGVLEGSSLHQNLTSAIILHSDSEREVLIDSYVLRRFNLTGRLLISADYLKENVEAAVRNTLIFKFSFKNRNFGQDVFVAEIISAIQGVQGIVAVDIDSLIFEAEAVEDRLNAETDPSNAKLDLTYSLTSKFAHWDSTGKIIPADLLIVNPSEIKFEDMTE
ncbi:MAG: hypothetical protein IIB94_01235 [Candidatus Marinimicrobia bacterium]|nr:hypothetical protein [Candidatus Neomarinimicrobiota bacterium]